MVEIGGQFRTWDPLHPSSAPRRGSFERTVLSVVVEDPVSEGVKRGSYHLPFGRSLASVSFHKPKIFGCPTCPFIYCNCLFWGNAFPLLNSPLPPNSDGGERRGKEGRGGDSIGSGTFGSVSLFFLHVCPCFLWSIYIQLFTLQILPILIFFKDFFLPRFRKIRFNG